MTIISKMSLEDIINHKYTKNEIIVYFYGLLHDQDIKRDKRNKYYYIDSDNLRHEISYRTMKAWFELHKNSFRFEV